MFPLHLTKSNNLSFRAHLMDGIFIFLVQQEQYGHKGYDFYGHLSQRQAQSLVHWSTANSTSGLGLIQSYSIALTFKNHFGKAPGLLLLPVSPGAVPHMHGSVENSSLPSPSLLTLQIQNCRIFNRFRDNSSLVLGVATSPTSIP